MKRRCRRRRSLRRPRSRPPPRWEGALGRGRVSRRGWVGELERERERAAEARDGGWGERGAAWQPVRARERRLGLGGAGVTASPACGCRRGRGGAWCGLGWVAVRPLLFGLGRFADGFPPGQKKKAQPMRVVEEPSAHRFVETARRAHDRVSPRDAIIPPDSD